MNQYPGLEGKGVLVTGAARGLGKAVAEAFGAQGARLALVDSDEAGLNAVGDLLAATVGPAHVVTEAADLADLALCESVVERLADALGRLDVLVNNAAIIERMRLETITPETFERVLRVNLMAPFFLARAAIGRMRRQGEGGRIINVASMAARTGGTSDIWMYAASKGGLLSVTRSLARTAAPDGILVNAILPSNIDSEMLHGTFPAESVQRTLAQVALGRAADPAEVAELVLWLASDAATYVTGVSWDINGGWYMS